MLQLRDYQTQAIDKILWAQQLDGNDLCILPTGAGKSVVIADLAKRLGKPILILQPSKEILTQNYKKLCLYVSPDQIGIYSASLQSKEVKYYTFATIQSIYKKPEEFQHYEIVIIDECHTVNPKNMGSMFTSFINAIGNPKVIGFTATPYRLGLNYAYKYDPKYKKKFLSGITATKMINRMRPVFWNRIIFNINNADLLAEGYLSPLEYIDRSVIEHANIPVNKSQSDFDLFGFEMAISRYEDRILKTLAFAEKESKHVLVFCSSVGQAEKFQLLTPGSYVVTAKTPSKDRDRIIEDFKNGTIKTVFNVGVLTTGFDHPSLDCIVLLRPTRSIALYYQMLGRGVRISEGKKSCKVIDVTGTVRSIGKVESIKLDKNDGKWDLKTDTGWWHNVELYSYRVPPKKPAQEELL